MTIQLALPALVLFAGLALFWFGNAKAQDVGRIMFACGLLVSLFEYAGRTFHLG